MREPIWSSIDGITWQVVVAEPFRCNIIFSEKEEKYRANIVNMEVTGTISEDFLNINEAKDWCVQSSKILATEWIRDIYGVVV